MQRRLLETLATGSPAGTAVDVPATAPAPLAHPVPDGLTPRDVEVMSSIAAGLSNRVVAAALFVSEATVNTHVNHLLAKPGMRDRAQRVGYAFRRGIVSP